MIAAVKTPRGLCPIVWTGKTSMVSVKSKTYCGLEIPAGDGVLQVPDDCELCGACTSAMPGVLAQMGIKRKPSTK